MAEIMVGDSVAYIPDAGHAFDKCSDGTLCWVFGVVDPAGKVTREMSDEDMKRIVKNFPRGKKFPYVPIRPRAKFKATVTAVIGDLLDLEIETGIPGVRLQYPSIKKANNDVTPHSWTPIVEEGK